MISGGGIRSRFDDASGLDGSIEPNASAPAPAADNVSFSRNNDAMEPVLASIQDARLERRKLGPYYARTNEQVKVALGRLLEANGLSGQSIGGIARMQGGASKEQFVFEMDDPVSAGRERFILRMDPRAGIVETCRRREAEIVRAIAGVVPCPETVYLDAEGEHLGQPGLVARFVPGVTKPSASSVSVSGFGSSFDDRLIGHLAPQFIDYLVRIHAFDYRRQPLPSFAVPDGDPKTAALWQVNYWARVWREEAVEPSPLMAITEAWLRDNLPDCEEPVMLHGDYRKGNFMFDEASGQFTAVLDWELAHIGDFHEDLAFNLLPMFGNQDAAGNTLIAAMFSPDEYLRRYERASGRKVNPKTLRFYEILNCFKLVAITQASAARVAQEGLTHQDALLSFVVPQGHCVASDLCRYLREEV